MSGTARRWYEKIRRPLQASSVLDNMLPALCPQFNQQPVVQHARRLEGSADCYRALISNWTRVDELEVSELEMRRIRNEQIRNDGGGHITPPPGRHF